MEYSKEDLSIDNLHASLNISINLQSIPTISTKSELISFPKLIKFILILIIILCIIILIIVLLLIFIVKYDKTKTLSSIDNLNTTISQTILTTTITCPNSYSQSPSGICVNLQIDFNNCGSFNYICSLNYTSCSAGICSNAPSVQLPGAIPVPDWGGQYSIDDAYLTLDFPMNLTLFNITSSNISVTSNGVVCLDRCSSAYSNGNLPDGNFGGPTAFGFWDDLMIYSGTSQTVYYNINGILPNRTTTFEFYESHYGSSTEYYHFQIIFYEYLPNIIDYKYFQISDGGQSATIGLQQSSTGPVILYSINQYNSISNNLTIRFDTITGTYITNYNG